MSGTKLFKDPIYGYVQIPNDDVRYIIDTAEFQRLKRITQTSYSSLYPSSVHSRFAHSMGVYYLGSIAGKSLTSEIDKKFPNIIDSWDNINNIFLLSCLLHDIGHSPFSHTGERFFLNVINDDDEKAYKSLHGILVKLVGSEDFKNDIPGESGFAAVHEIMSAIIGLKHFSCRFSTSFEKEIFARCITGYKFSLNSAFTRICNCYISMLKSKVIDVDRLDYLIRDAYFTGFDTVRIDYQRLLTNVTITDNYELAFNKGAISVIENFVYAHDSERKWIQTHPSVLYEMYILQHIFTILSNKYDTKKKKLFSMESISVEGHELNNKTKISLICDDDIIYLMKNKFLSIDPLCKEYFSRNERRRTFWKTEAEYKAFFLERISAGTMIDDIDDALNETEIYLRKNSIEWVINNVTIEKLKDDIKKTEEFQNRQINVSSETTVNTLNKQLHNKKQILRIMNCMKAYAESKNESCDFIILKANQFYSGFNTEEFSNINIVFKSIDGFKNKKFHEVGTPLSGSNSLRKDFYYIYYKRSAEDKFNKEDVIPYLIKNFI